MSRFLPQPTFNGMAIARAMMLVKPDPDTDLRFTRMIDGYVASHAGEDRARLMTEVEAAGETVQAIARAAHDAVFDPAAADDAPTRFAVLKELMALTPTRRDAAVPAGGWRTWLRPRRAATPAERVAACGDAVAAAARTLMARHGGRA